MSQIARPLAVAVATTVLVLVAAFVGNPPLGLLALAGGALAFLASTRPVLSGDPPAGPLATEPTSADPRSVQPARASTGEAPPVAAPRPSPMAGSTTAPTSPAPAPEGEVILPASVSASGGTAGPLLHPSILSKAMGGSDDRAPEQSRPILPASRKGPESRTVPADNGFFSTTLTQRVAAARRTLRPLSLILIEPAWLLSTRSAFTTETMEVVGEALRDALRESDIAFRYDTTIAGALLEDTSEDGAIRAVERLRAALGDAHPGTRVTSIAVACYPSHALDATELLERALEALEYLRDNQPGGTEVARTD